MVHHPIHFHFHYLSFANRVIDRLSPPKASLPQLASPPQMASPHLGSPLWFPPSFLLLWSHPHPLSSLPHPLSSLLRLPSSHHRQRTPPFLPFSLPSSPLALVSKTPS